MKGGGAGFIIIGFLFLWIAITGRLDCFFAFIECMTSGKASAPANGNGGLSGELGNIVSQFHIPSIIKF